MIIMLNKQISSFLYIIICIVVVAFTLGSCTIHRNSNRNSEGRSVNPKPGSCYAKAKYPGHETYDWVEVVCDVFYTKNLLKQLQQKLSEQSYLIDLEELNQIKFIFPQKILLNNFL